MDALLKLSPPQSLLLHTVPRCCNVERTVPQDEVQSVDTI